tara:strand:+ start:3067 stop:3993 length:927 start_codon:yes stop_codon:yes gene_type:complete
MSDPITTQEQGADALDSLVNSVIGTEQDAPESVWDLAGIPNDPAQFSPKTAESNKGDAWGNGDGSLNPEPKGVDDPNSYKYFQQRYDQAQNTIRDLTETASRQSKQLEEVLYRLDGERMVNPGEGAVGAQARGSQAPLEMPLKPERPADFDQTDALTDSQSASYKYLRDLETFNEQRYDVMQNQLMRQENALEIERQRVEQQTTESTYRHELQNRFGFNAEQSNDFIQVMNDPNVLTFDNLVHLYRHVRGQPAAEMQTRQAQQRHSISLPPVPASVASGASRAPQRAPEDVMIDELIGLQTGSEIFPT